MTSQGNRTGCIFVLFFPFSVFVFAFKFISTFSPKKWNQIYETVIVFTETSIQESHTHNLHENKTEICPTQIEVQRNSLKCTHTERYSCSVWAGVYCVCVVWSKMIYLLNTPNGVHIKNFTIFSCFHTKIERWNKKKSSSYSYATERQGEGERERERAMYQKWYPGVNKCKLYVKKKRKQAFVTVSFYQQQKLRERKNLLHICGERVCLNGGKKQWIESW